MNYTETIIFQWLHAVKDPEIPVLSIVDLGIISSIECSESKVSISVTPTFLGCPAVDVIKNDIHTTLKKQGVPDDAIDVTIDFTHPWSSERITQEGKAALRQFGIGPPPTGPIADLSILERTECPQCGSHNTELRSPFGPTLCRSIHFCTDCRETFEQFKPL